MKNIKGFTMQFGLPDILAAKNFYAAFFGREPDVSPYDDFHEWELRDGTWFQLGQGTPRPGYAFRIGVTDIETESTNITAQLGIACGDIKRIEGLVAFGRFSAPWGRKSGFYQDPNQPVLQQACRIGHKASVQFLTSRRLHNLIKILSPVALDNPQIMRRLDRQPMPGRATK